MDRVSERSEALSPRPLFPQRHQLDCLLDDRGRQPGVTVHLCVALLLLEMLVDGLAVDCSHMKSHNRS